MSEARGKENGGRGWRGDEEEEGQQGGGALLPGFLGGVKDVWLFHCSPLAPHGLQVKFEDHRSVFLGRKHPEPRGSEAHCRSDAQLAVTPLFVILSGKSLIPGALGLAQTLVLCPGFSGVAVMSQESAGYGR